MSGSQQEKHNPYLEAEKEWKLELSALKKKKLNAALKLDAEKEAKLNIEEDKEVTFDAKARNEHEKEAKFNLDAENKLELNAEDKLVIEAEKVKTTSQELKVANANASEYRDDEELEDDKLSDNKFVLDADGRLEVEADGKIEIIGVGRRIKAEGKIKFKAEEKVGLRKDEKAAEHRNEKDHKAADNNSAISTGSKIFRATNDKLNISNDARLWVAANEKLNLSLEERERRIHEEELKLAEREKASLAFEERERLNLEARIRASVEEREQIRIEERAKLVAEGKLDDKKGSKDKYQNVCVWEQNINAYLKFSGKVYNEKFVETRQFDRELVFTAKDSVLYVKGHDLELAFDKGIIVEQPRIKPEKRDTNCKQIARIIEHEVSLEFHNGKRVRLVSGSFMIAHKNSIVVIRSNVCGDNVEEVARNLKHEDQDSLLISRHPVLAKVCGLKC